ncbi:MAG: hypothetical protein Q9212_002882 [Teloschistes hypoglaucus]
MASSSQPSAFASEVFQIVVGAEEKIFYAHASLLSKSEVLRKEVEVKDEKDLGIKDTRAAKDLVSSVSSQGFQWNAPPTKSNIFANLTSQDPDPGAEKPHVLPLTRVRELIGPKGDNKSKKMSKAEEYDKWTGHLLWRPDELDYDNTIMIHAELYIMASQYLLDELKDLTWQRLRSVLVSIGTPVPGSLFIRNLVKVLRYVYKETGTDSLEGNEEPLRRLVSTFVAQHFTRLKGPEVDEIFASTRAVDREIVIDVTNRITQEMVHLEAEVSKAKENEKKRDISEVDSAYYPFAGKGKCNKCKGTGKFPCP